jgi:hypothetical protein
MEGIIMKKYMLNLKENEEMMNDVDDQMETIMAGFTKAVKDLNEDDLEIFANWVKVYKLLNYDIIPDLKVEKIFRLNDVVAGVVVNFRGVREFDLLSFNHKEMTVTCLNAKDGKSRDYIVRRLLVPTTVEEALMYAKQPLDKIGNKLLVSTFEQITKHSKKLDATESIINNKGFLKAVKEEPKQEVKQPEVKEEPKQEEVKEPEVKEEPKQEEVKELVNEIKEEVKAGGKHIRKRIVKKVRKHAKEQEEKQVKKEEVKDEDLMFPVERQELEEKKAKQVKKVRKVVKQKEDKEEIKSLKELIKETKRTNTIDIDAIKRAVANNKF